MTQSEYESLLNRAVSNFEDRTYENLMQEALDRVSAVFDKRPGSMLWNGNAPCLAELAQLYIALNFVFNATFIQTAPREYLIKRAADRSLAPKEATKAVLKAVMNMRVPVGARFSLEDLNFVVTKQVESESTQDDFVHLVECETAGSIGSASQYTQGDLIPIDYIDGLTRAKTDGIYAEGEDEEDTEVFRARVIESLRSIAFGGNIADYKAKLNTIQGVGQAKVLPVWNGPGTVKLILMSPNAESPVLSSTLISDIQKRIDPLNHRGEGYGLAPIGHTVTVESVVQTPVDVSVTVSLKDGDKATAEQLIREQIERYFSELAEAWQDSDSLTVRLSYIQHYILDRCSNIIKDVTATAINGLAENLTLDGNAVPALNSLSVTA